MNIQSLSVCVPAPGCVKGCINDCKFCCSKMHGGEYEDRSYRPSSTMEYIEDLKKRMQYARDNGCNTLMLTGNNEPQQNKDFLRVLGMANKSLREPFLNIEMQTSGAFIDGGMLDFLKDIGVTTMALSISCIDSDAVNRDILQTPDRDLCIQTLCDEIKKRNMNLRICLNMNDNMLSNWKAEHGALDIIMTKCKALHADQITCRVLWSSEDGTPQAQWISENVTRKTVSLVNKFKFEVKASGRYLDTLEYGFERYDYMGFSTVIDEDCMARDSKGDNVKYLIIRPDGHLYSKWDSKASLIF